MMHLILKKGEIIHEIKTDHSRRHRGINHRSLSGCGQSAPTNEEASVAMTTFLNQKMQESTGGAAQAKLNSLTLKKCSETKRENQYDCGYDMKFSVSAGYGQYAQTQQFESTKPNGLFLEKGTDGKWVVNNLEKN